ncbi:MAG: hypothetical protein WDM79_04950 [Terricaulis sp.]
MAEGLISSLLESAGSWSGDHGPRNRVVAATFWAAICAYLFALSVGAGNLISPIILALVFVVLAALALRWARALKVIISADKTGLVLRSLYGTERFAWAQVSEFRLQDGMIAFTTDDTAKAPPFLWVHGTAAVTKADRCAALNALRAEVHQQQQQQQ